MINILDFTDEQMHSFIDSQMVQPLPEPMAQLRDELLELLLRLREIKILALDAEQTSEGMMVPAEKILVLLDGNTKVRRP